MRSNMDFGFSLSSISGTTCCCFYRQLHPQYVDGAYSHTSIVIGNSPSNESCGFSTAQEGEDSTGVSKRYAYCSAALWAMISFLEARELVRRLVFACIGADFIVGKKIKGGKIEAIRSMRNDCVRV
jgi:hypothetical protein